MEQQRKRGKFEILNDIKESLSNLKNHCETLTIQKNDNNNVIINEDDKICKKFVFSLERVFVFGLKSYIHYI